MPRLELARHFREEKNSEFHLHDDLARLRFPGAGLSADHDRLRALSVLRRRCGHVAVRLVGNGIHVRGLGFHKLRVVGPTFTIHLAILRCGMRAVEAVEGSRGVGGIML